MIGLDIKVTFKPTLEFRPPSSVALGQLGQQAFAMIRDRILKTGKLGNGKSLPKGPAPLKAGSKRWPTTPWSTSLDDPRFQGAGVEQKLAKGGGRRVFKSYKAAKAEVGADPSHFGELTGAMWRSGSVLVTNRKGEDLIVLGFKGSTRSTGTKTTAKGKVKPQTVLNREKAAGLQRLNPDGSQATKAKFDLMELTPGEMKVLAAKVLGHVRFFKR